VDGCARLLLAIPLVSLAFLPPTANVAPPEAAALTGPDLLRSRLMVVAAGDIACASEPASSGSACRYGDTAELIDGAGVDVVLTLGDNQYDDGLYRDFLDYFDPTWGDAAGRLRPVPGNHEYAQDPSANPTGYFRYFGPRVGGPDDLGYYSFDLGECPDEPCWHVIALNSMLCFDEGGCGPPTDPASPGRGNEMWRWLRADLRRHPNAAYGCTLAYWHHPLFSFSSASASSPAIRPLWKLLARARADVVLNGHSHNYQRWAPLAPDGERDAGGIRQFIVGTGGASRYELENRALPPALVAAQDDTFGVLRLALKAGGYRWQFVPVPGDPAFEDTASRLAPCH